MKILVVDDEQDVAILFKQRFRKEIRNGYAEFLFAFSAEEALEHFVAKNNTDLVLILSDINMPGMSGIELLKKIRARNAAIGVLMVTAYDEDAKREEALAAGATDYLTKPIDFEQLKTCIRELTDAHDRS